MKHPTSRSIRRTITRSIAFACLAVPLASFQAWAGRLDVTLNNNGYLRDNLLDPHSSLFTYNEALSISAEDMGRLDFSVFADGSVANTFNNPDHKNFELSALLLDFGALLPGLDVSLGRTRFYDLTVDNLYADALFLRWAIGKRLRISADAGWPVPSRYVSDLVQADGTTARVHGGVDVMPFKKTWIGIQAARQQSEDATQEILLAGYADSRIIPKLRIHADARYNVTDNLVERYGVRLGSPVLPWLDVRALVEGTERSTDSVDAYTALILQKHTDIGAEVTATRKWGQSIDLHYALRLFDTSTVHLVGISGSVFGATIGCEFGLGGNQTSVKPMAAYRLRVTDGLSGTVAVSYITYQLPDYDSQWKYSTVLKGRIDWIVPRIGITVVPEIQLLWNSYYSKDVRGVLNARYTFGKFWASSSGEAR